MPTLDEITLTMEAARRGASRPSEVRPQWCEACREAHVWCDPCGSLSCCHVRETPALRHPPGALPRRAGAAARASGRA